MGGIGLIVEGHGDQDAAPIVVRRVLESHGIFDVMVPRPVRLPRGRMVKPDHLSRAAGLAIGKVQHEAAAEVLVLYDSDGECPVQLAATSSAGLGAFPIAAVVIAHTEFESWYLASIESLRGIRGIAIDAAVPPNPEGIPNPKERIGRMMGRRYSEIVDQPPLAAEFDLALAEQRSRSFRKFQQEVLRLAAAVREG